ncbi:MAG TPA: hybrid sensor histidine kinase/response regulator [Verrucomicrobiae bacterium]|nr:hybrid sensor histidine kinase/response regulator [Verrucomicrobiae bacterium]
MPKSSIYDALLAHEGIALFEFRAGAFTPLAALPAWCDSLWHTRKARRIHLAEKSPFLENFLLDADEFWKSKEPGSVGSGNWIEKDSKGKQIPLEASAFWLSGKRVLLIRNLSGKFVEQQRLFQTARDSLLEHESLMREIQKKEILLHCIIHDLSQPLTSMRGCFELLLGKKLAPEVSKLILTGRRESQRQERMIRGILEAFSADLPAERAPDIAVESADLISCARRAVEQFSPAFAERDVQLVLAPYTDTDRDWRVIGDAPRIDRIFGNLLENALRYSPRGARVTVGVEGDASALRAFVDDEGPGLPQDAPRESIFGLFAKGRDRPGKAGLGLYFCKMTVERWGGAIGADDREDGGSRFWFRLPRAASESGASAATPAERAADPPAVRGAPPRRLRILVADDDTTVRELTVALLRTRGHEVVGAADGRQALAALERVRPDVVLLDQEMPQMSGLEAARAIRERETISGPKRTALIGLSGNATAEDRNRSLAAGMDALLSKPIEATSLFQVVESLAGAAPAASKKAAH